MVINPNKQILVKHKVKIKVPEPFNRTRTKLLEFLGQVELYIYFNSYKFKNKTEEVFFIITLLKGAVYN